MSNAQNNNGADVNPWIEWNDWCAELAERFPIIPTEELVVEEMTIIEINEPLTEEQWEALIERYG